MVCPLDPEGGNIGIRRKAHDTRLVVLFRHHDPRNRGAVSIGWLANKRRPLVLSRIGEELGIVIDRQVELVRQVGMRIVHPVVDDADGDPRACVLPTKVRHPQGVPVPLLGGTRVILAGIDLTQPQLVGAGLATVAGNGKVDRLSLRPTGELDS